MAIDPNTIHKLFTSRVHTPGSTYVGESGRMFYHESTGELRLSDGITPGGLPVLTSGSGNIALTGVISSTGNVTYITSQTGTGNIIVVSNSPALTGIPTAPTANLGTNTTQIATTAFVQAAILSPVQSVITVNTTYLALPTDYTILANASTAAFTISLPSSPSVSETHNVKKIDATINGVTVSGNGKLIDGASTAVIQWQYESLEMQFNGASWSIL